MTSKSRTEGTKPIVKCDCGLPLYLRRLPFGPRYVHKGTHRIFHDRIMAAKAKEQK